MTHRASERGRVRAPIAYRTVLVCVVAVAVIAATAGSAPAGTTFLPHRLAVITNERYNHDCFWGGPKGMDYANLPGAQPIQKPNLYPDVGSTYFVAQYLLPAGASLTFHGKFPHERYWSWTMIKPVGGNQLGPGDHLRDMQIAPDHGSVNPFLPRNSRDAQRRYYTLHVVAGPTPRRRAQNTLYTGSTDPTARVRMSMRNYLPDRGMDGTGGAGLPKLTLTLANGRKLHGAAACRVLQPSKAVSKSLFPQSAWANLVASSPDPLDAPAVNPPSWERFWNAAYSVAGAFVGNPFQRAQTYPPTDDGGFQSNPDTRYLTTSVSLKYGSVVTVTGKLPTFPETLPANPRWRPHAYQLRYWALCTGSSPVSGLGYSCAFDQQVPLRGDRRYTVVISRPQDRPRNATAACGYAWLTFGRGEDYPGPAARDWVDVLYMRFMAVNPRWPHSPQKVKTPGTEARVMGPYFPHSEYTNTAAFEQRGCHTLRPRR